MPLYQHASGERVRTVANSHEDNRLGMAAMDPGSGWHIAGETPAAPAAPAAPAPAVVAATKPAALASTSAPAPEPEAA